MSGKEMLEREIAALGDLAREELAIRWMKAHGCPPPKGVKRGLLERSAAWHLQTKMFGGLSPEARRALKAAMRRVKAQMDVGRARQAPRDAVRSDMEPAGKEGIFRVPIPSKVAIARVETVPPIEHTPSSRGPRRSAGSTTLPLVLSPGARLLREWNGRRHFVDVVEDGYVFDGRTYRSLSAVAKRITGAHWSGPRFFGL